MPYSPLNLLKIILGKNKITEFKMFQTSACLISHCVLCFEKIILLKVMAVLYIDSSRVREATVHFRLGYFVSCHQ